MNYIVSASTNVGNTKETNQDSHMVKLLNTCQGKMVFAIVCDGMGGLQKGEVASATVVAAFDSWVMKKLPVLCQSELEEAQIRRDWSEIITECNEKIKIYGKKSGINLGTTVTAMLITPNQYFAVNVGDTRAYEITNNLKIITKDQTVVAREVEQGHLTPEQAAEDERRNVLLQCIGASEAVYPDFFNDVTAFNAVYMLCSDGFRHQITSDEIHQYLQPGVLGNQEMMKKNMDALIKLNMDRQETDNITVLAVKTY